MAVTVVRGEQVKDASIGVIDLSATGVASSTTYLRGDNTWSTPPGGSGSFTITEVEIDFGSIPMYSKRFTITDASINSSSKIMVTPSGSIATGRIGNDWEWDAINFSALSGTGNFLLTAKTSIGRVKGKRKIYYSFA